LQYRLVTPGRDRSDRLAPRPLSRPFGPVSAWRRRIVPRPGRHRNPHDVPARLSLPGRALRAGWLHKRGEPAQQLATVGDEHHLKAWGPEDRRACCAHLAQQLWLVFLMRPAGDSELLDVLSGDVSTLAPTHEAFKALVNDWIWQEQHLVSRLMLKLHNAAKLPARNECYAMQTGCAKPPPPRSRAVQDHEIRRRPLSGASLATGPRSFNLLCRASSESFCNARSAAWAPPDIPLAPSATSRTVASSRCKTFTRC